MKMTLSACSCGRNRHHNRSHVVRSKGRTPQILNHCCQTGLLVILATGLACARWQGQAATLTVTDPTQKSPQAVGGTGCSLVEAIYAANFDANLAINATDPDSFISTECDPGSGADTIQLPAGAVFKMNQILDDGHNPFGPTATPIIFSTITIEGNGATIEWTGTDNARLFTVGNATISTPNGTVSGKGNLTLRNVYIKGFHAKGGDGTDGGGGGLGAGGVVYVQNATLNVENCTFENNGAVGGNGGVGANSGGGGGLGGNGGKGNFAGGGGGGSRGNGGDAGINQCAYFGYVCANGGGGGGTVFGGASGDTTESGGYLDGGTGHSGNANAEDNGSDATGVGGGGGGGGINTFGLLGGSGSGGNGLYGGGGGGGAGSGGDGGFGGGGGCGVLAFSTAGGSGGFGGGAGAGGAAGPGSSGPFGGNANNYNGGGGGALGGAIFGDAATITIVNSTFYNNYADRGEGGSSYGTPKADNGGDAGGAIFAHDGSLLVENCTISSNQGTGSGAGVVVYGDNGVTFSLFNTIIANNGPLECFASGNYSLAGAGNLIMANGTGTQPFNPCPGFLTKDDPLLGTLTLNTPGITPTMAIDSSSPAFDTGSDAHCLATDQRGVDRPQGYHCDIGAFELVANRPPVAQCQDVTVSAGADCTATASVDNGSYDLDDADTISLSQSPAGPYGPGTTQVTLTVTDNHGASSSCTGRVTVVDNTGPAITCPANITRPNDPGKCSATVTFSATTSDNCSSSVTLTCSPASGSAFPIGDTTVKCQATDAAGNSSACSFVITVTVGNQCPLGQGFWKLHPALWPSRAIPMTLGKQSYSQSQLMAIVGTSTMSDASLILARQLIAAILNTANGSDPGPVCSTIAQAQTLLRHFSGNLPYRVSPSSSAGKQMVYLSNILESYNLDALTPGCTPYLVLQ